MPDPDKLPDKQRAKLLGCVKAKNKAWKEKNQKSEVPEEVRKRHFRDCSRSLGYD